MAQLSYLLSVSRRKRTIDYAYQYKVALIFSFVAMARYDELYWSLFEEVHKHESRREIRKAMSYIGRHIVAHPKAQNPGLGEILS